MLNSRWAHFTSFCANTTGDGISGHVVPAEEMDAFERFIQPAVFRLMRR